ncbi:predicted protein [Chaetoceros tenuissimus]|uniref:Uncharacterized protein n=1 Tax=Chaetoceros tenuissimus TaxID=426638 RepID=A0AAD3D316_9STRA|nr:predicted protein [Chaetoceros tenuissimus]
MIKTIEHYSKVHGVNLEDLMQDKVLSNKSCFWSLLQSQTDRFNHYYYDQEHKSRRAMKKLAKASTHEVHGSEIRADLIWLLDFVEYNTHLFSIAVRKFDSYHSLDTFDDEKDYFEETYPFVDGHRLQKLLDALDIYEFEDWQKNESNSRKEEPHTTRSKKRRCSVTKELVAIKRQNSRCSKDVVEKERRNLLKFFKTIKTSWRDGRRNKIGTRSKD